MFTHRPATFACDALMLGLAGPSSAGKTLSALRVATGLAGDRPIYFVDTEKGRGLLYARQFKYEYVQMDEPYSPARYLEAVKYCVAEGAGVTIIDSGSHEHEGTGGVLEMQEAELLRMVPDGNYGRRDAMKFTAWIKPKAEHNRMVNGIIQLRHHMIWCFRAKDKLELVKVEKNGRQTIEPIKAGWTPICTDRFEYEMTAMLVLPPGAKGRPAFAERSTKLNDELAQIFHDGEQLTEEHGRQLARWAGKEQAARAPDAPTASKRLSLKEIMAEIEPILATAQGMETIEAIEARDDVAAVMSKGSEKQQKAVHDLIAAARARIAALDGGGDLARAADDDTTDAGEVDVPGSQYMEA